MSYQPHELSNLSFAGKYFSQLSADDISKRYYSGEQFASTLASRAKFLLATDSILSELNRFYPYQPQVTQTYHYYKEHLHDSQRAALIFSGLGVLTIFYCARQNIVAPLFSKFGRFLKTHRLFRQYLYVAILPYLAATLSTNAYFRNQTELLWAVHARRLNEHILTDPEASKYPREHLPVSQVGTWFMPSTFRYDLPNKWANETHIALAPAYADVEEWEKVAVGEEDGAEAEEGEEGEEGEE